MAEELLTLRRRLYPKRRYPNGHLDLAATLHNREVELAAMLRLAPGAPVVADAAFQNQDQEYRDAIAIDRIGQIMGERGQR